jgi:hypothetical protein
MSEVVKITRELLSKEFGLNQAMVAAEFEQRLQERLVYLMLNDMEGLLQLLYRIDVNEQKVKAAFAQSTPQDIAPELAKLIIDRMRQKAETRVRYQEI